MNSMGHSSRLMIVRRFSCRATAFGSPGRLHGSGLQRSFAPRYLQAFQAEQDFGRALPKLKAIEKAAWKAGADVDLYGVYKAEVMPLVPRAAIANIRDRLRPKVQLTLHTNKPRLFKRESALLNRLGAALVIHADAQTGLGQITTIVGIDLEGDPIQPGRTKLVGRTAITPWRRFLRWGPDGEENVRPFADLARALPPEARNPRPATPSLSSEAQALFGGFTAPASPPAVAQDPRRRGARRATHRRHGDHGQRVRRPGSRRL